MGYLYKISNLFPQCGDSGKEVRKRISGSYLQEKRRRKERIMSICLTWFPIRDLGEPKLYQNMWCFTRSGKVVEVSDCEELSGGYLEFL